MLLIGVGALIGLLVGSAIGHDMWIVGALAGGVIAHWATPKRTQHNTQDHELAERLFRLESEVAFLRRELDALRAGGQPELPGAESPVASAMAPSPAGESAPESAASEIPVAQPEATAAITSPAASVASSESAPPERTVTLEMPQMPDWLKKFWAANPLAKIGIVLLFFGVASGLRLAIDHGLLPVPLRLLLTAAGSVALIAFGIAKARDTGHHAFGLALQGGGFALLYLVGYFMLDRYAMIGQELAFALFAVLGVACVFLAARQDGPALAVLGLSGAFLAPVLAGGRAANPLPLFSYFALLNTFILAVDWFKSWRVLNIAGFVFTLAVGMTWAVDGYHVQHYLVTQIFVVLFLAVYSAMPVVTALLRAPGLSGWRDGMLLFGTPLVGAFLQTQLMQGVPYGLAWSALLGSLWYFGLWALLFRRPEAENRLIERSHLGIAIALLTVSVPLAFGTQVTSAFWAAEGSAVLWFGVRMRRALAQGTGLLMQIAAGGALLLGWHGMGHRLPVANEAVLGAFILVLAGLFSARSLRSRDPETRIPPELPLAWATIWWLGTGLAEIHRFAAYQLHAPFALLFITATGLGLDGLSMLWRWPQIRATVLLLLAALWATMLTTVFRSGHPFAGFMALALPLSFIVHYALLAAHEKRGDACFAVARHIGAWWLLLLTLTIEVSWQAEKFAPRPDLWAFVAVISVLAAGVALPVFATQRRLWPFVAAEARYTTVGVAPALAGLALLLPLGNVQLSGTDGLGWPYIPLLNLFDAAQLCSLGAMLLLARTLDKNLGQILRALVGAIAFVWLSALAARIAHHWGGVPFTLGALMDSTLFQALLTLFWTITAIVTMIHASRRCSREFWFGGIGLLGIVGAKLLLLDATGRGTLTWTATLIGVALLVLAASYFAPLPPKEKSGEDSGAQQ